MKTKHLTLLSLLLLLTIAASAQKEIAASMVPNGAVHKVAQWFPHANNIAWFTDKDDGNAFDVFGRKRYAFEMHLDANGEILYLKTKFSGADDSIFVVPQPIINAFESAYPNAEDITWAKGDDKYSEDNAPDHYHAHITTKLDSAMAEITFDSLANIVGYGYAPNGIANALPDKARQYIGRHYRNYDNMLMGGTATVESGQIKTYRVHIHDGKHFLDYIFDGNGNFIKEEKKLKGPPKNPFE